MKKKFSSLDPVEKVDSLSENLENTCKAVETTKEVNAVNSMISAIVIDHECSFLEGSQGHEECAGLGNLRGPPEIEQKEALVKDEQYIFEAGDDIDIAMAVDKHAESTKDVDLVIPWETGTVAGKENFVLRKLLRNPRYFDLPISNCQICHFCGKDDHKPAMCKMERRKKPCYICGGFNHIAKHCKQGRDCFKCCERGHLARDCSENPSNNGNFEICLRCRDSGHDMFSCHNDYSLDDLKEIQCYVCKEFGHLCCFYYTHDIPKIESCYKCGQNGHLGSVCTRRKKRHSRRAKRLCNKCEIKDHLARECREYAMAMHQ